MPEYVYALHDFTPENEDEVPFRLGEPIEVIEKDDAYGDGWWQVSVRIRLGETWQACRLFLSYTVMSGNNGTPFRCGEAWRRMIVILCSIHLSLSIP